MNKKRVLITGAAGFIGSNLAKRFLQADVCVAGVDNMNSYYDVSLKEERLKQLRHFGEFVFWKGDIADGTFINNVFNEFKPEIVVNLAAQAGVRYSIDNPASYMESNIMGFFQILEACRHSGENGGKKVEHLIFASSSSVYGNQEKTPFSITDPVDKPISLYAATKKSNELMAYTYSHLYQIPSTGLRFFTVYGPMGRPDMAYFSFSEKIMNGEAIKVYNNGDMYRDFTYIDDIIEGMCRVIVSPPVQDNDGAAYRLYNIGNNKPEKLMYFIETLEDALGKKAVKEYYPMQPGDVYQTYADITGLEEDFDFKPNTSLKEGIKKFAEWYLAWREENTCK